MCHIPVIMVQAQLSQASQSSWIGCQEYFSLLVYIHFRLERPQDCLKFDLFQSICFASQQLQIAFDAWQDRGLSDF